MIQIIDEFFSNEICDDLISYFENNKNLHEIHRDTKLITLFEKDEFQEKKFNFLFDKINEHIKNLNNCEITYLHLVKWFDDSSQNLHYDKIYDEVLFSSISYLNDQYTGGQTFFEEGTTFKPKKGRMLFFDGTCYKHGVTPVKNGPRYTLASWYKRIEK